jgi:O-antigen ligase
MSMYEVGKVLLLYLLIIALVNTPARLNLLIQWLTCAITVVATLALLDRSGVISIAALEPVESRGGAAGGATDLVARIRGTGIFQDPNDFGLIVVTGLIFIASFFLRPQAGWPRYLWLGPGAVLLATLALTHSRGALMSLACAFPAVVAYRGGWKSGALSVLCLPLLAVVFSSRMTDFAALNEGTGQDRIQIWSEALTVFRQHPFFGLGAGLFVDEYGVVAHNSYLHCYAELGILGGTAFLACFLAAALGLWSLRSELGNPDAPDDVPGELRQLAHLRMFVFAAVAAYAAGMLTLSRQFVAPTYLILGLAAATTSLHGPPAHTWRLGRGFLPIALLASVAFLLAAYLTVRILVRW